MSQQGSTSDTPTSRSRAGSISRPKPVNPFGPGLGYDPARESQPEYMARSHVADNRNLDLPPEAYVRHGLDTRFTRRPGFNDSGKVIPIHVNMFRLKDFKTPLVHQYSIEITPPPLKLEPIVKKCWAHPAVKGALASEAPNALWILDGKALAWSAFKLPRGEIRVGVDLDQGRDVKPERVGKNVFTFRMKKTAEINMAMIPAYLKGQTDWTDKHLEAMNFFDHLIRQYPSENLTKIKRNFYSEKSRPGQLDTFLEVMKGIYASVRLNESIFRGGMGLGINVDVANTAFWSACTLSELMCRFLGWADRKYRGMRQESLAQVLAPVKTPQGKWGSSEAFKHLRKLQKIRFTVRHRGKTDDPKTYMVAKFAFGEEFGSEGATARSVTFQKDGKTISVLDYFQRQYNQTLRLPSVPLVVTARAGFFPVEVCNVCAMERYNYKLDGEQTSKMIKFAVTRPDVRKADIMSNCEKLNWESDPYFKSFGMTISPEFAQVSARLLQNPEIKFGNATHNPGVSGRWDLRGKKFLSPNRYPLKSWAFLSIERATTGKSLQEFANTFAKTYTGHGGVVADKPLLIDQNNQPNVAAALEHAYRQVMQKWGNCQLIFVVLRAKNTGTYERIKKSADCRFGILTQCIQAAHVEKNQGQYHSNVAMKVNAKLGGVTCKVVGPNPNAAFPVPTMILGCDVSHAAPGSPVASMAAVTMSINKDATRYAAACETNGHRVEMLSTDNIHNLLGRLSKAWLDGVGQVPPQHVYYFRDGVAEGQYIKVLMQEVSNMRQWFGNRGPVPKFTVIIATKRHHIRFFPPSGGDRYKNPLPGTLVEQEVTHPFQWDFYLCSHVAIQGTARPVHYSVILDEANCKPNDLQRMIYSQCYQYIRSTTPVSLHPAVYYAHLASNRARFHENMSSDSPLHSGGKAIEVLTESLSKQITTHAKMDEEAAINAEERLLPLGGSPDAIELHRTFINNTMWYI